ncbi:hypothetical protein [Glaciibacter superstes]|nr:hypothetical protein [Glaciibacter superstes]
MITLAPPTLAVTGSTGAVGRLVAENLAAAGIPIGLLGAFSCPGAGGRE